MEDWAEIRRLYRGEGVPIKEIARRLGVVGNTVRAALNSGRPPKYERAARGSVVDRFEPQIRALLTEYLRMPGPVVAEAGAHARNAASVGRPSVWHTDVGHAIAQERDMQDSAPTEADLNCAAQKAVALAQEERAPGSAPT